MTFETWFSTHFKPSSISAAEYTIAKDTWDAALWEAQN